MELKIFSQRIKTSSIILGVLFVLGLTVYTNRAEILQYLPTRTDVDDVLVVDGYVEKTAEPGLPLRLKIPKIDIDAKVEYVSLTSSGEMDVPKDTNNVAWYEPGVRPGKIGNAVIAGHYGWSGGKESAFDELYTLQIGDKIYIEDEAGAVISFIVRRKKSFKPSDDASEVFNATEGGSHLNLIACEGEWDEVSESYSKRLVVFAERE